jgi:bis(5'-nucleosyl)-tetraphosphatase (symmetrical)
MALYLIGDIQGCDEPLERLLQTVAFSPSRDTLFLLGDLVNRGPASDAVLRRLMGYGSSAVSLLGNHDLHLLAVHAGVRQPGRGDTLDCVLQAPDAPALLHWLRHQHMARLENVGGQPLLMVHAGVLPSWTAAQTLALAQEVEAVLRSDQLQIFLPAMYGNTPDAWSDQLQGAERLRVIVNSLTRLRFCSPLGVMEFKAKEGADAAPAGYLPWFEVPGRRSTGTAIAFGHWSTLGWLDRSDVLALDSGCVWGGCLSALRLSPKAAGAGWDQELVQVRCPQAQRPGA